jgi:hypothetical protein
MTGIAMINSSFGVAENPALAFDFVNPPQLVSAGFNGSSQYLTVPASANYALGTEDFTIEWWQYQTGTGTGTFPRVFSVGATPASIAVSIESGTFYFWENGNYTFSSALTGYLNTWTHFAISRVSGQTSVYRNGTQIGSTYADTNNINDSSSTLSVGREISAFDTYFPGYISNFRIVKGTGVYTGNFATPTKPLTAVTNTVLLLSMGATPFIDTSTNTSAVTVTNVGTVTTNNAFTPFSQTWTDSLNSIAATVAINPNAASVNRPKYDGRYGGGIVIAQTSQSYVDVPTARGPGGGFTISMAAVLPIAQGDHYVPIFDGSVTDRVGQYINARNWVGDGLEVGGQATWAASNSTTVPSMQTLAWWDFVFNGRFINVYKNGAAVTMAGSDLGAGNSILGWKNPLRFAGDDSISANNTMWPGTLYRMIHTKSALSAAQVTAQYNAVKSTYGL